jgi:hypothetical protein
MVGVAAGLVPVANDPEQPSAAEKVFGGQRFSETAWVAAEGKGARSRPHRGKWALDTTLC